MKRTPLSQDFIDKCGKKFKADPLHIVSRNAVTSVGAILSSTNSNQVNKVNHVFMNTVKRKDLKATNQGYSGRCWLYGGLNVFRHAIINGMGITNFEFSETYLFFYDKLERSNTFLQWIIDNIDKGPGDREFDYTIEHNLEDGGWWNCFVNLVDKYGLIPQDAMKETYHSGDSGEMNNILIEKINGAASWMHKNKTKNLEEKKNMVIEDIYRVLVLFLGEPPKEFTWAFTTDEGDSTVTDGLTPLGFKKLILADIDLKDFVSLSNLPISKLKMQQKYEIIQTNNIVGESTLQFINVPMSELSKAAAKSVTSGFPVWFTADVQKYFHPWHATLDDELIEYEPIFGGPDKTFDKGKQMEYNTTAGCHAMTITGVNIGSDSKPVNWQVENSWGFVDYEVPGLDGWLSMTNSWFDKYVSEVVVHRNFLTRSILKLIDQKPIQLNPWDCSAPAAIRAGCVDAPKQWKERIDKRL
jgi:bleomycin hydrolase